MKRTIIILFTLIYSVTLCMAQQNIQAQQQIESRYQEAIGFAQKHLSQRQYSEAKQYYLTARELKPENAAQIDEIIVRLDKLLAVETNSDRQVEIDTDRTSTSTYQGTMVPGATLTEKLDWLDRLAESHNTYIIEVNADESIAPRTLRYKGGIDITVVLRGDNQNRTIRLSSHGTMFTVNTDVTFILDGNITLQGHKGNGSSMIEVSGGILKMNAGTTITGNYNSGVNVRRDGTFEMNGGTISRNIAKDGGGVYMNSGVFIMNNGIISDNIAHNNGGGINVYFAIFHMKGGEIKGNTANLGGGVCVQGVSSDLNMYNGSITNNTAHKYGGGVYCGYRTFNKTGGTITGYNSSQSNGNMVKDDSGVIARRGHAVYYDFSFSQKRKETTAGPGTNLSSDSDKNWDQ